MVKSGLIKITCAFLILASILVIFKVLTPERCNKKREDYTVAIGSNNMVLTDEQGNLSSIQFPKGMIIAWNPPSGVSTTDAPSGWAICDGTNSTPDLRGKFLVGSNPNSNKSDSYTVREVGVSGGEESHTLTISEIPAHKHNIAEATNNILLGDDGRNPSGALLSWGASGGAHGVSKWTNPSVDSVGSGTPHNNMPPFYSVIYIMKL
jgi:hypothetical protein